MFNTGAHGVKSEISLDTGVDSVSCLRFLPKPDLESDFRMKTGPGAGVRSSVFTWVGQLILLNLNFL